MLSGFHSAADAMKTSPLTYACAATLSLFMSCAVAADAPKPATATDWTAIAKADYRFALDNFRHQHAGVAAGDLSEIEPLATAERTGMSEAAAVRTVQDYLRLMTGFVAAFGDPHTGINLHLPTRGWTGLVLDQLGADYRALAALYGQAYADQLGGGGASGKYLVASPASVERLKRNMGLPE